MHYSNEETTGQEGFKKGNRFQALLGGTGSGKFKKFFPEKAVEYFVFWHADILMTLNIAQK